MSSSTHGAPATRRALGRTLCILAIAPSAAVAQLLRVHVPASLPARPVPLLVVLHGCLQGAADFARMSGFSEAADRNGFVVLYPEQTTTANPARCWNWFEPAHQKRAGEAAAIVAMIDSVGRLRPIDSARVYLAGHSAGGAMAVNVASLYPERFAGVMSHSGIPVGAATNAVAGIGTMALGPAIEIADSVRARLGPGRDPMPLLVMHGKADLVVSSRNAQPLTVQWMRAGGAVKEVIMAGLGHGWAPTATQTTLEFFRILR